MNAQPRARRYRLPAAAIAGFALLTACSTEPSPAQSAVTQRDPILVGAIDIHTHPGPDDRPRSVNAIDYALTVRESGMRGFVFKQHNDHTAGLAYLVRRAVDSVEVFGTMVLNQSMGGVNVPAVERFARTSGGWGRIVSMPTMDISRIPLSNSGELLPEVKAVIAAIAAARTVDTDAPLAMATGHAPADDVLRLVEEARRAGVGQIMITHPLGRLSLDQMRQVASQGALLEFTADRVLVDSTGVVLRETAEAIRAVGPESAILSSDLGRIDLPLLHPDALSAFAAALRTQGFSDSELQTMLRDNPAKLLSLPPVP